ncbi:WAT1-related protein At1g09380 [Aristolochia californica]|uniref:WAT1-related protein At1g09380 n=1 Tax=Aristolochia californica TaxID=171875 RepID=UPI0035DCF525
MSRDFIPALAMVIVQVGFAGLNIFSKLAMDSGMNPFVMVAYRQIIAAAILIPFAYLWERKTRPKITRLVLFQIFLCSIFGATMNQCLYFLGLKYTNPTIGCALTNLLPAVTFIIAVPFRMETVRIKTVEGQAKVWGTVLCVGGAMLMTFYKGKLINTWESSIHWSYAESLTKEVSGNEHHYVLGSMLVVVSCLCWAIWFIVQAKMSKSFHAPYSSTAMMIGMASIECSIVGLIAERDLSQWALGINIRLVAAAYSGIVCSGISFALMTWCIGQRGPLFVSMFSPLLLISVAVLGWAILAEKLHVGSVTGSALIVAGLYAVLWGKGRELKQFPNINGKTIDGEHEELDEIALPVNNKMTETRGSKQENEANNTPPTYHSIDCSNFDK